MEATELRIGNYIVYNGGQPEDIDEFTVIEVQDIAWVQQKNEEFNKYHSPIPLIEEWLLKFGFKCQDRDVSHGNEKIERFYIIDWFSGGDNWSIEINLHPIRQKSTGFFWLNWDIGAGKRFVHLPHSCELKYVHQLQNLYFALTGEELTIN